MRIILGVEKPQVPYRDEVSLWEERPGRALAKCHVYRLARDSDLECQLPLGIEESCEPNVEANHKQIDTLQHERRTDVRIAVNVPVEINTIYHKGDPITERTIIEDVSDFGCHFTMKGAIRKGDTVSVRLLSPDGQLLPDEPAKLFEVMWIARGPGIVVAGARILGDGRFDKAKFVQNSSDAQSPS